MHKIFPFTILLLYSVLLAGQEKYISPEVQLKLDELDKKIEALDKSVNSKSATRDASYFYKKRELGFARFLREYEELIYDEDLKAAQNLIDARMKAAEKMHDEYAIKYFKDYENKLINYRIGKQKHYQELFAREKNFKKEYDSYISTLNEHSLIRAQRMIELAINYAKLNDRTETLNYLYKYQNYNKALMLDHKSSFNLEELTGSLPKFEKQFNEMLISDSIETLQLASELLEECIIYSNYALTKVDSNYFLRQRNVAANAIADWNRKQGMNADIATLTGGSAVIAYFDTINKDGIFKWDKYIVVIGRVKFESNSEMVRRGQAIAAADKKLFDYIRLNRIAELKTKERTAGHTFIIPYNNEGKKQYYKQDKLNDNYQYMVSYQSVVDEKVTLEVSKYLPPLQFQE